MLVVPIVGLDERRYPIEFLAEGTEIGLDRFPGTVRIDGTLSVIGAQYRIDLSLEGTETGACDRCLTTTERTVGTDVVLVYEMSESAFEQEDGDILPLEPEASSIVLDDEVRQALLLAAPLKNLCRPECSGLCPRCGVDRNQEACSCDDEAIDPRWSRLKSLFDDTED